MQTRCIEPDNARDFRGANHQIPAGVNQSTVFESIMGSAQSHASREAGLPGRVDRETVACRSCDAETTSGDGICPACADAMREERAAAQSERCRVHRVRFVEDLPVHVLEEMQRGRC
jgi:hypothetical protein